MNSQSATVPTRKRFGILALLFVSVVINYMDRANIGVASSALRHDLDLSMVEMGLILSAFGWTYAIFQVPGGIMVDLFRTRVLYTVIMSLWSVATVIQGLANSMLTLIGCRMSIGVFEAPSFPCNNKIVTSWFPDRERATAISIYTSGQFLGLAFLTYFLVAIQDLVGWRGMFFVTGAIGIGWAAILYWLYRDPRDHPTINSAEVAYIRDGGGHPDGYRKSDSTAPKFSWGDLAEAFQHRKLWGVYLGQYCLGAVFWFFLAWFPLYLTESRGLTGVNTGIAGSIPFLGAFFGVLLSGIVSDHLLRRGFSMSVARKAPVLCGMALTIVIVGANYTTSTPLIIVLMTLAFFGNGLASIAWVFISSISPVRLIGMVGGVFNGIGSLSGATVPFLVGWLARDGDFKPAFAFISILSMIGFCSYLFLVGKVERIEIDDQPPIQTSEK